MKIQKLSHDVVDQIAAGEVLERPANMIKELIENSVDAGATEIEIDIDSGGRKVLIKDNGHGIEKEDLVLALDRHATSKIHKASDLWALNTFGFRGEALASIASVSQLTLSSKAKDANKAYAVHSEFGKKTDSYETNLDQGTSILVEELFANVPARLKFLKSDTAETTAIKKMLKAFSLSFPHVSIRLKSGGKQLSYYPKSENLSARCSQVLERKKMYETEIELGLMSCKVVYCAPNEVARNSQNMWFFVQDRWIQDRSLQAAVIAGFENTLMHGEYPICAVWIHCDPQEVDVNVHPTKSQVKFRDPRAAFRVVRECILKGVAKAPWLADMLQDTSPKKQVALKPQAKEEVNESFGGLAFERTSFQKKEVSYSADKKENSDSTLDILAKYASPKNKTSESVVSGALVDKASHSSLRSATELDSKELNMQDERVSHFAKELDNTKSSSPISPRAEVAGHDLVGFDSVEKKESDAFFDNKHYWSKLQVLGQADNCYIVAQSRQSLILVDQHAAHERISFERIVNAWAGGHIDVQNYLLPLEIKMEEEEADAVESVAEDLLKLSITVERLGPDLIGVSSAPILMKEKAISLALFDLSKEVIKNGGGTAVERKLKDIAATMACHSSVRAGQALSFDQMKALLEQMDEYPLSSFCPHGRPVFVEYPFTKIDKDFGRIL